MQNQNSLRLLALLACAALLGSCGGKTEPPQPEQTETEPFDSETTAEKDTETQEPIDYSALGKIPFEGLETTAESDFSYSVTESGACVTAYLGSAQRVRVPDTLGGRPVTAIGDGAFRNCTTVKVLYLPDSVTDYGEDTLVGMTSLYALHAPLPTDTDKCFLGWLFGAETYERNNVEDLRRVDFFELGGTVTEIPSYAFFDCNDLITVAIQESVSEIGAYAFARCASLQFLNLSNIATVGEGALFGCSSLQDVTFGESLKSIGRSALSGCTSLKCLTLPFVGESRTEHRYLGWLFGADAAEQAMGVYPSGLREIVLTQSAESIANDAFYAVPLRILTVHGNLGEIGARAFADCTNLKSICFSGGLKTIRENAFAGCSALTELTLPEGVETIGINAFLGCTRLERVTLPRTLSSLPACCFMGCERLKEIELGGVRTVGINAFRGCGALRSVRTESTVEFDDGNDAAKNCLRTDD